MKRAAPVSTHQAVEAIGIGLTALGATVLVGGIVNLGLATAIASRRGEATGSLLALGGLPVWMLLGFLVIEYWRSFVVIQFVLGGTALGAGIGFLHWRSWARGVVEAIGWVGTTLAAAPLFWIGRSILRSPDDRMLGLRAGLETLPEVGQAVAIGLEFLVGGPVALAGWVLRVAGVIPAARAASGTFFAWTETGIALGTVASVAIPVASALLVSFVRRRGVREACSRALW